LPEWGLDIMASYMDSIVGGNPFDYRRLGGILQGQAPTRPSLMPQNPWADSINRVQPPPPTQPAQSQDPLLQMLQRMQGGQATQAYRQHVGNMPDPQDYAASKTRRLGSALTAAAASFGRDPQNAMNLGAEIRDAPLKSAVTQWQMKGAGLKEQADLESQDVQGQIKYLTAVRQMEKDKQDQLIAQQNADTAAANAASTRLYREGQIKNYEAQNWTQTTSPTGDIIMVKPGYKPVNMGPSIETTRIGERAEQRGFEKQRLGIAQGQLGVAQGQLGVAGRNATNQEKRTGILQQNADTAKSRLGNVGFVSPSAQISAKALAVRNVVQNNPGFAQWVDEEGVVIQPTAADLNSPKYKRFKAALEAEENLILSRKQTGMSGMGGPLSFDSLED
jgi:hypothetical protein